MDFGEGVGESSSPPRSVGSSGGGGGAYDIRNEVYNRLLESGNEEVVRNPELLREQLEAHFIRLPSRFRPVSHAINMLCVCVCVEYVKMDLKDILLFTGLP